MPSKYPDYHRYPQIQFRQDDELHDYLAEHQREGESINQTAARLLREQIDQRTPHNPQDTRGIEQERMIREAADGTYGKYMRRG